MAGGSPGSANGGNAGTPGGSGAGNGHVESSGPPTAANVHGKVVNVAATPAPSSGDGSRSEKAGQVLAEKADNGPKAVGSIDGKVPYDPAEMNKGELEVLPPRRREIALRYLQKLRETSGAPSGAAENPVPAPPAAPQDAQPGGVSH
jgi:hypothetical protein